MVVNDLLEEVGPGGEHEYGKIPVPAAPARNSRTATAKALSKEIMSKESRNWGIPLRGGCAMKEPLPRIGIKIPKFQDSLENKQEYDYNREP